jgi:hypothetical protein
MRDEQRPCPAPSSSAGPPTADRSLGRAPNNGVRPQRKDIKGSDPIFRRPASGRGPFGFLLAVLVALVAESKVFADDVRFRVLPNEVLVVFNDTFADGDGNGKSDSRDVAEYYAARRGVPAENLLPLDLKGPKGETLGGDYPDFYRRILAPVAQKLAARAADGRPLSDRIVYIVVCYGVPVALDTHIDEKQGEHPFQPGKAVSWNASRRSVDQWLIDVEANDTGGFDASTGKPRLPAEWTPTTGAAPATRPVVLGARHLDIRHPELLGLYASPQRARHFKALKRDPQRLLPYYLVTRLGTSAAVAACQVDGAIYAERYLRLTSPPTGVGGPSATRATGEQSELGEKSGKGERNRWRPGIVLDHQPGFAADHVAALARLATILQGGTTPALFGPEKQGLYRPWPVTVDNQRPEIGEMPIGGPAHRPMLSESIAPDGVDSTARLVRLAFQGSGRTRQPTVQYWSPGLDVTTSFGSRARIVGLDFANNALRLDPVEGFKGRDTIAWRWTGQFPITDCFVYYGFYGLGKRWDCYQFLPGAIGIHVDSSCMTWASHQLARGLSVAFGVVNEPFSSGIPYMDQAWLGLATGHDVCESLYAGLYANTRWAGVLFADPLYAPFRSLQLEDHTAPVITNVRAVPGRRGELIVSAELADGSPDARADIALWQVEYGPTSAYGQTVPFVSWPEPENTGAVKDRRYQFSRRFRHTLTGLTPNAIHHVRLTARDPAGNESRSADLAARTAQ